MDKIKKIESYANMLNGLEPVTEDIEDIYFKISELLYEIEFQDLDNILKDKQSKQELIEVLKILKELRILDGIKLLSKIQKTKKSKKTKRACI